MSHTHPVDRSEAHQQKIDEILSIYIQSEMIGRKSNNLNLKISSSSSGGHFTSNKPPRSVPVKLKNASTHPHSHSSQAHSHVPSKPSTVPASGLSQSQVHGSGSGPGSGRHFSKSSCHASTGAGTSPDKSFRHERNLSRSSTATISPKKGSSRGSNILVRGKSNFIGAYSSSGNGFTGTGNNGNNMGMKDNIKDVKVTFCSEKMRDFQIENSIPNSNFQFQQHQHPQSKSNSPLGLTTGGGGGGSRSSASENDDETITIIPTSTTNAAGLVGRVSSVTPPRCMTSPSSRRESPRLSPTQDQQDHQYRQTFSPPNRTSPTPTFSRQSHHSQYSHQSHSNPCSPKRGDSRGGCGSSASNSGGQSTESYARILATLKRIEDEERYSSNANSYNNGNNFVGGAGRGDFEQNNEPMPIDIDGDTDIDANNGIEKSRGYSPNLPLGDHDLGQIILSIPGTPINHQGQDHSHNNQYNINSNNVNVSPSPNSKTNSNSANSNHSNSNNGHSQSPSPRKLNSRFTASTSALIMSASSAAASSLSYVDMDIMDSPPPPRLPCSTMMSASSTPRLPPLSLVTLDNNPNGSSNNNNCNNNTSSPTQNTSHSISNSNSNSHSQSHSGNSRGLDCGSEVLNTNRHIGIGLEENFTYEIHSARSYGLLGDEPIRLSSCCNNDTRFRPASMPSNSPRWGDTSDEKAKNIFSFLDEVEKSDRETLFNLKLEKPMRPTDSFGGNTHHNNADGFRSNYSARSDFPNHTMDSLIRKGSVELAREVILLERKIEEVQHNVTVLEETLINQRELNIRHIKNSERDLKKRLKLQQEEFELALTRHQAFVDQLIAEKRGLQDKCEKILRDLKDTEMKHQDQVKSLQSKHLDELKRIRRVQESSEKNRRMKWMGNKTQEIRETTIKGLEPELQRVIQRHQQEMTEMRAWHSNELQEMEDRCARKLAKQSQEIREQMLHEKDEGLRRDRELISRRHESDLDQLNQELESQKRRHLQELSEERERFDIEQQKVKELIQENIKKVEIKSEVELETLKEQYEAKFAAQERRHETELKTLSSVHEAERESYVANYNKKLEQTISEKELLLAQTLKLEKEAEIEEREQKLRRDFEKQWTEQEDLYESRLKRLQDKFQGELKDFEEAEKELKTKFSLVKAELISKEEEIFSLKTTVNLKEKQNTELADNNMKMVEERASLTGVIRREFITQIENLEKDCLAVKSSVIELKAKHKLDQEQHSVELDKLRNEKDFELDKVGQRVVQAMARKEETILELQKQLEKAAFRVNHLEELLEQQRKEFIKSMTLSTATTTTSTHNSTGGKSTTMTNSKSLHHKHK